MQRYVMGWLVGGWQWPAAGVFTACFLLLLAPVLLVSAGLPLTLVYLQLPIYLLHQGEEHLGDRFRLYINRTIGGGREALTPVATFWINALGVWGVDLVALYLAAFVDLALGLVAIYLPLVNAAGHVLPALGRREYNPGLATSLFLFLPVGIWSLGVVAAAAPAAWPGHVLGLGIALAVHAAIMAHVARRLRRLSADTPSGGASKV